MGEAEFKLNGIAMAVGSVAEVSARAEGEMRLTTPGGRYQVRWDDGGNATCERRLWPQGQFLGDYSSAPAAADTPVPHLPPGATSA